MRVERTPVADEYAEDGELVLLLPDGRVVALSALASAVIEELRAGPAEVSGLARRLVEEFGPPPDDPDAVAATRSVVGHLAQLELVTISP